MGSTSLRVVLGELLERRRSESDGEGQVSQPHTSHLIVPVCHSPPFVTAHRLSQPTVCHGPPFVTARRLSRPAVCHTPLVVHLSHAHDPCVGALAGNPRTPYCDPWENRTWSEENGWSGWNCLDEPPGVFSLKKWRLLHLLSQKVASPPPFVSKSGVSSTFCLKKWRRLHLLSQKVASPPPFVSKSGVSSTFSLKKWRLLHLLSQKVASPPLGVAESSHAHK